MPSPQNGIIMKTIMTFSMDENGQVEITTGNEDLFDKFADPADGKKAESFFREVMTKMVGKIWGDHNTCMSKVVRILSMAEVCSSGAPYEQAEDFWSTMMFSVIPNTEKYLNPLKSFYGFDPKRIERPRIVGNTSFFQIGKPNDYPWRKGK
jgi:hypothetical protein